MYKTVILPVVLYECETWYITVREDHRLSVFENRLLRREELAGGWRRLRDEELHNLYVSPNISWVIKSRRMILAGRVARM
jgi:hypothetical protein